MSRVRWAVRTTRGEQFGFVYSKRLAAQLYAREIGGEVVRITQYNAAETKVRRAVIEAAKRCAAITFRSPLSEAQNAFATLSECAVALEALKKREVSK